MTETHELAAPPVRIPIEGPEGSILITMPTGILSTDPAADLRRIEIGAPYHRWSMAARVRTAELEIQQARAVMIEAVQLDLSHAPDRASRGPTLAAARIRHLQAARTSLRLGLANAPAPCARATVHATLMLVLVDNNAGADDEAEGVATALATTCPTSTSTVDTSVSVGDRAFERGEHVIAERHYRAALAVPGDPAHLRAYAGYRLAWVHLATGDLASARSELEAAQVIATDRLLRRELERSLAVVSDREAGVEAAPPPQQ